VHTHAPWHVARRSRTQIVSRFLGFKGCSLAHMVGGSTQRKAMRDEAVTVTRQARCGLWAFRSVWWWTFDGLHLPTRRKILGLRLGDELPDDLGFRGAKLLDELLELGL
jgi:hypothetical protein